VAIVYKYNLSRKLLWIIIKFVIPGRLFYKCSENVCNFLKWANEDSAKFQDNAGKKHSMVSRPDKNSDNFSRRNTSKDNSRDNPSTNIMCNCNQPLKSKIFDQKEQNFLRLITHDVNN